MDFDPIIGKFDKLMHEHGRWFLIASVIPVALLLFLLWVYATRRLPEEAPLQAQAMTLLRHLL